MRAIICAVILLSFARGATPADDDKVDGKKLLGQWEHYLTLFGEKIRITHVFLENDKITVSFDYLTTGNKSERFDGTYKLDNNFLIIEWDGMTCKGKITKLTDDDLVFKDSICGIEAFKKVKPKK